jgi:NAD(P)-dependent dehydrogenase (short-subunit alcohol dehydrogenase family)
LRLREKVCLITGSTAGIGRATAELFAAEGARVVVTGRNEERGADVEAAIREAGGEARFIRADLRDEEEIRALVAQASAAFGRMDVLMNNASPTESQRGAARIDGPVTELAAEEWHSVLDAALTSHFLVLKHAIPAIAASGGGSIINISSTASVIGIEGADAYVAAKGALNALTRSLANEYAPFGIRVNTIVVGFVVTSDTARAWEADPEIGPRMRARVLTRLGEPRDIAYAALFLASDESAYVTGSQLFVDGGASIKSSLPPSTQPRTRPESLLRAIEPERQP